MMDYSIAGQWWQKATINQKELSTTVQHSAVTENAKALLLLYILSNI